jgi:hypothetical protein
MLNAKDLMHCTFKKRFSNILQSMQRYAEHTAQPNKLPGMARCEYSLPASLQLQYSEQ